MTKGELKALWGKYADTDKMVDDIMELLTTYQHRNSEHGVCVMLHTFFTRKEPLIQKFIASPHYIGDLRIGLQKEFARGNNAKAVRNFCSSFESATGAREMILSKVDDNGKTMVDYMLTGTSGVSVKNLSDVKFVKQLQENRAGMNDFYDDGYTKKSKKTADTFHYIITEDFARYPSAALDKYTVDCVHARNSDLKLAVGLKTSRAFNRVCEAYGINKAENYNKLFAQYADMVSDLKRNLNFYISLNPYDYLTMSFGNSWASCHTIDKNNIRNMPDYYSGGYCGGCLSYMLDSTSIITFALDVNADVQKDGKIYRNMFHFGNSMLMQGRMYPQDNDGSTDLYKSFRDIMQEELALMFGLTNEWNRLGGRSSCERRAVSYGVHYRDYRYKDDCNISYPVALSSNIDSDSYIEVGSTGICPYCGGEIESSNKISHNSCDY